MLWFIRHAAVDLDLDRPASTWTLSAAGRAAAADLAASLAPVPRVCSSPEPKAVATAEPLALASRVAVELDPRLREVERPTNLPGAEAHRAAVAAYLAGRPIDTWEPREAALARFAAAVAELDDTAVVTHATVLSLFLGYDVERWEQIALPDVIEWRR
jgi:broad specificity phosphatase PhoE